MNPPKTRCVQENLTHRNMLSDRARAKLLQPSHIYDELDSIAATVRALSLPMLRK